MTSSPKHESPSIDGSTSRRQPTPAWRAIAAMLLGCTIAGLALPAEASSVEKVLTATPLVLKDGRIAEVAIHTIPFPDDAAAPASAIRRDLDAFTHSIATDCFLTAQVIGHVDKSEINGRETADIHRLARARADTIQASLVENGLPAASIASVWDWRFMVQQPRVTLWVFRLTAGEDCEDTPLVGNADQQVAAVAPAETPIAEATPKASPPETEARAERPTPQDVTQQIIPAARPKNREVTAALPAVPPTQDDAVQPEKPTTPAKVAAATPTADIDGKGRIGMAGSGALEIVFATNSSYFPEGAGDQLRAFIQTLDEDKSYVLRIQTSVDAGSSVSGTSSSDEAKRYNAWLAERRFKRVEAWLLKNGDGRKLTLEPSLIENDASRMVRVVPNPLG